MITFTPAQQAKHCRQLADFLEKLPSKKYDHEIYSKNNACGTVACALGWAAHEGIGGLESPGWPSISDTWFGPSDSAELVFGPGVFYEIFSAGRPARQPGESRSPRIISIQRLRERAKLLTEQARSKSP